MTGAKDSFKLMDIFRPVNLLGVVRCLHDLNPETVFDGPKLFKLLYRLQPPLGKGGKAVQEMFPKGIYPKVFKNIE